MARFRLKCFLDAGPNQSFDGFIARAFPDCCNYCLCRPSELDLTKILRSQTQVPHANDQVQDVNQVALAISDSSDSAEKQHYTRTYGCMYTQVPAYTSSTYLNTTYMFTRTVEVRKLDYDSSSNPQNLEQKENQPKSSQAHIPTFLESTVGLVSAEAC